MESTPASESSPPKPALERLGVPMGAGKPIPANGAPGYLFLAIVSIATLGMDIASKLWAEKTLDLRPPMAVLEGKTVNMGFQLARNKGGAWGLLQGASENLRRPFFLLVSALAIGFIVYLFSRLQPRQRALRWGLPLVLGGALGNVFDRIRYGFVIDFIDVHVIQNGKEVHWPTFNVADIAICVGVALMAIDMFGSKRSDTKRDEDEKPAAKDAAPAASEASEPPEATSEAAEAKADASEAKADADEAKADAEEKSEASEEKPAT
jgi:lipoprotein signal peptidase